MTKSNSKRIVIDASVIRAAGSSGTTVGPSKECRLFLTAVLDICHRMVMTPDLQVEWVKHASRFSRKWRLQMEARKKVVRTDGLDTARLEEWCTSSLSSERDRVAAAKDIHLISAALETDKLIASLDEIARGLFTQVAEQHGALASLVWVNPNKAQENAVSWLSNGANSEKHRMLSPN